MAADTLGRFSAGIVDAQGVRAQAVQPIYVDSTNTIGDLATGLTAWASAVQAASDGKVVSTRLTLSPSITVTGADGKPTAGSEVGEVGILGMSQAGIPLHYGVDLPSIVAAAQLAGGRIDITETNVAALITLLHGAVAGGSYVGNGVQALVLPVAYSTFSTRKHRAAQHRLGTTRY